MNFKDFTEYTNNVVKRSISGRALDTSNQLNSLDKLDRDKVIRVLQNYSAAVKELDLLKKAAFYDSTDLINKFNEGEAVTDTFDNLKGIPPVLIHGSLGVASEGGELVDALIETLINGKEYDYANLDEEVGDLMFYVPMLLEYTLVKTLKGILDKNGEKLAARYKEGFSTEEAVNRNLTVERTILEQIKPTGSFFNPKNSKIITLLSRFLRIK
jgi:NTP pyrophosphatase (non-canonical NTP hydrolase)